MFCVETSFGLPIPKQKVCSRTMRVTDTNVKFLEEEFEALIAVMCFVSSEMCIDSVSF